MKRTFTPAALSLLLLAACGAPAPQPDTTPPEVLFSEPTNGQRGVLKDAQIVVHFSEPMDPACTEAAYDLQDAGLKPNEVRFVWDDDATLRIVPNDALAYSSDENDKVYSFVIQKTACDRAGNTMNARYVARFYTLRKLSGALYSEAGLDGYVFNFGRVDTAGRSLGCGDGPNEEYARAFLSFDLSQLNPDPVEVVSARLLFKVSLVTGDPAGNPGPLLVEHVHYGARLTENAFDLEKLRPEQPCALTNLTGPWLGCWKGVEVNDDVAHWAERTGRAQFRLRFQQNADGNGSEDSAMFYSGDAAANDRPRLELIYYGP